MRVYNAEWKSRQAGPSPTGFRSEVFLQGCSRGRTGKPCPGCFNEQIWPIEGGTSVRPYEMVESIVKYAPAPYVTFVGGEPLDQITGLLEVCQELKERGFHIIVFTGYSLDSFSLKMQNDLMSRIDLLIDGEYLQTERIWDDEAIDGVRNFIGSGNQRIWMKEQDEICGVYARDILQMMVLENGETKMLVKNGTKEIWKSLVKAA